MIEIRKAAIKDMKAVQRLSQLLFETDFEHDPTLNCKWTFGKDGKKYFSSQIRTGNVFVAVDNKKIVGYLSCIAYKSESWRKLDKIGELDNMFVLQEYRSQGIGKMLFQEFVSWCKSKKIRRIKVAALAQNTRAIEFYRKNGFRDHDLALETDI